GHVLVVDPAQHPLRRARVVVLHELADQALRDVILSVIGLDEEPALIMHEGRLDDDHAVERGRDYPNLHDPPLSSPTVSAGSRVRRSAPAARRSGTGRARRASPRWRLPDRPA